MIILVSGGAASGKSEFAESLILQSQHRPLVYLATMEIWDAEDQRRADRHRMLRRDKGFQTLECSRHLEQAVIPAGSAVLLECMSNLCVNECFGPEGFDGADARLQAGLTHLTDSCGDLVIVTNDLFCDGRTYTLESEAYKRILADLNRAAAAKADQVWEVCCGIPIRWK